MRKKEFQNPFIAQITLSKPCIIHAMYLRIRQNPGNPLQINYHQIPPVIYHEKWDSVYEIYDDLLI